MNAMLLMKEAAPIVIAAWKNAQTLRPASAKTT
jgi:hypothetical protein